MGSLNLRGLQGLGGGGLAAGGFEGSWLLEERQLEVDFSLFCSFYLDYWLKINKFFLLMKLETSSCSIP